jgi:adenine-specific DNA-methyltransferase
MIKYLGSKRALLPVLEGVVDELGPIGTALDLFAGTTRVGRMLKRRGVRVHSNDTATYSEVIARSAIATDAREVDRRQVEELLATLSATPPAPGYFTETFCEASRYVHPDNGARVDAIRAAIDEHAPEEPLRSIALTSLLLATDRVDSTTGVQMAYLKQWAPRALQPLELRAPDLLDGPGSVSRLDAAECARTAGAFDLAYIDPPYNQHSYYGNYHVWETLVRNDAPETYGVACKRVDCRTTKSPWNSKVRIREAFEELIGAVDARHILVSFNDEGYLPCEEIEATLSTRGEVRRIETEHTRYVGARIGIHNPAGEKVGTVGHVRNKEFLFRVTTR